MKSRRSEMLQGATPTTGKAPGSPSFSKSEHCKAQESVKDTGRDPMEGDASAPRAGAGGGGMKVGDADV